MLTVLLSVAISLPIVGVIRGLEIAAQEIDDQGDLVLTYDEPKDSTYTEVHEVLLRTAAFDEGVAELNDSFAFPQDIQVTFAECGEENAYYDPAAIEITMCYELIQRYVDILGEDAQSQEEIDLEVIHAGLFTFLHELGHALVDQYQLPVTGKEEDAVDSFAAILLIESGEEGEDAAIAGVDQFSIDAEEEAEFEELAYWDEHSLSIQRFYDMACLVYGSDPDYYADWVEDEWLPQERAEQCPFEYEQESNSWNTLLQPFLQE
jgi:hypothetical protein